MVVKERRGRRRYVVIACDPAYEGRDEAVKELNALFRSLGMQPPHVIDTGDWHLIIRCSPSERDGVLSALGDLDRSLTPLRTSGTLKKLRARYGLPR